MPHSALVPINHLVEEPYASVVCYPRATPEEMQPRMEELKMLGVEAVEFSGKSSAFTLSVLGKGYVGIVIVAHAQGKKLALKMQRVDSERESLEHEAELLVKANTVGAGPQFVATTKHFLLMELIDGYLLEEWLTTTHRSKSAVQTIVKEILEQCWRLDEIGLDHGELSKAPKHLLVNKTNTPFIVDFETASTQRNASNVTSVCQFLFQGQSEVCKTIASIIGKRDKPELLEALRNYRKNRNRQSFETLLKHCLTNQQL
ncbi:RIO1 family regulatory kinase/ATPase [Candidatus Bathycorpusculum sp.]|uniref:RIO1 family regulatory kinase/ATPase domain-containing protein n=1 Tax=Candidatus Bathycorpusculum sp. TaxID=2994959 RepID=UPI00282A6B1E|nr:serine/threonine protein kinase [Candidatus Termitimicrobium sp.]MCL2685092.1 serine/threonine protein kinase [Candidatus Termitimicrobium sp.]